MRLVSMALWFLAVVGAMLIPLTQAKAGCYKASQQAAIIVEKTILVPVPVPSPPQVIREYVPVPVQAAPQAAPCPCPSQIQKTYLPTQSYQSSQSFTLTRDIYVEAPRYQPRFVERPVFIQQRQQSFDNYYGYGGQQQAGRFRGIGGGGGGGGGFANAIDAVGRVVNSPAGQFALGAFVGNGFRFGRGR